jgi:hypothetical protein
MRRVFLMVNRAGAALMISKSIFRLACAGLSTVMPGLVPGIHVFLSCANKTWMAGQARP